MTAAQNHFPSEEPTDTWHEICQVIILERGATLRRLSSPELHGSNWIFEPIIDPNSADPVACEQLDARIDDIGLLPVMQVLRRRYPNETRLFSLHRNSRSLDAQVAQLDIIANRFDDALGHSCRNVLYITRACLYHCKRLASLYADTLSHSLGQALLAPVEFDQIVLSDEIEHYFEFEALITALIRAYDTTRFSIWQAFQGRGSTPSNFLKACDQCEFPDGLREIVGEHLGIYELAKEYRDCVQHYAHLGAILPTARIDSSRGMLWSMTALLPDNPQEKSYKSFAFANEKDALSYGWRRSIDLVEFVTHLFKAIHAKLDC